MLLFLKYCIFSIRIKISLIINIFCKTSQKMILVPLKKHLFTGKSLVKVAGLVIASKITLSGLKVQAKQFRHKAFHDLVKYNCHE